MSVNKKIGYGDNLKTSINEDLYGPIMEPEDPDSRFTFDSITITFDSIIRTFDEI